MKAQKVILLLGGNQGNVPRHFAEALHIMEKSLGHVYARSRIYSTKAWGPVPQPDFLNMAVGLQTQMPPVYLLKRLLEIEKKHGRERGLKYGPRTLDIDMLFYGHRIIRHENLAIPHPEVQNRRFALVPCCDIAPSFVHPVLQEKLVELLEKCGDKLEVKPWKA